jgi:prolyl-tRNA synthetase
MEMGCYGIGVTRIVGAAIEQGHDERGIIFPSAIAPFEIVLVPMGWSKPPAVRETSERLYGELRAAGVDVILDDRDERPGSMLADWELIGIPHRLVIGERGLKEGVIEYQARRDTGATKLAVADAAARVREILCG